MFQSLVVILFLVSVRVIDGAGGVNWYLQAQEQGDLKGPVVDQTCAGRPLGSNCFEATDCPNNAGFGQDCFTNPGVGCACGLRQCTQREPGQACETAQCQKPAIGSSCITLDKSCVCKVCSDITTPENCGKIKSCPDSNHICKWNGVDGKCSCQIKICTDYSGSSLNDCSNKPACSATTKCTWLSGPQCTCVEKTCSDYTDPTVCSTQPGCSPTQKCSWNCLEDRCDCTLKTCSDYTDPTLCSTQTDCSTTQKCSWNGLDSCDCTLKTCSDYTDSAVCSTQPDCSSTHKCAWNAGVNRCDCKSKTCTDYTDQTVCSTQPDCSTSQKCAWNGADNRCACTIKQCTELTTETDCANGPGCSPTSECTWNGNRCICLELGCIYGDVILTGGEDAQYEVTFPTKFLGTQYTQVKFTTNGVLHFGNMISASNYDSPNPCGSNNRGPLLSFYWGDAKQGTGSPASKVCYRVTQNSNDLANAKATIVNAWQTDVTLTEALYIHIEGFTYYGAPAPYPGCPGGSLKNSYEVILTTNGGAEYFLIIWYKNVMWGGSNTNGCFGRGPATQTAIDDGTTATKISPKSCTAQIIQIDEDTNINHGSGNTGKFAFKVSGPTPIPPDA